MPEPVLAAGAAAAGVLLCCGVIMAARKREADAATWLSRSDVVARTVPRLWPQRVQVDAARRWLAQRIAEAGWSESPERVCVLAVVLSASFVALGLGLFAITQAPSAAALIVIGAGAGPGAAGVALRASIERRRRRLSRELAPLLELFILELGGGGSALSALGSVTMQLEGELAAELRRVLISSQVAGSASFESRLSAYAAGLQLPALDRLATILAASREYGTSVGPGVRVLAADLRRAQRRELIAHSRRALNRVLFPAAIGVLLPFLAILLFPAVSTLQRNLR